MKKNGKKNVVPSVCNWVKLLDVDDNTSEIVYSADCAIFVENMAQIIAKSTIKRLESYALDVSSYRKFASLRSESGASWHNSEKEKGKTLLMEVDDFHTMELKLHNRKKNGLKIASLELEFTEEGKAVLSDDYTLAIANDYDDLVSVAKLAILEEIVKDPALYLHQTCLALELGKDSELRKAGYSAVNAYVRQNKRKGQTGAQNVTPTFTDEIPLDVSASQDVNDLLRSVLAEFQNELVLTYILQGLTTAQIAEKENISLRKAQRMVQKLREKIHDFLYT